MATATRRRQTAEHATRDARASTGPTPRTGAKRTVLHYIRQLPNFLRLLFGLITDQRVAVVDKLLVFGAIAYLLVIALQRLISNAGRLVLMDHWAGEAADLADLNLRGALAAAAFFLPRRIRRRLRVIGR